MAAKTTAPKTRKAKPKAKQVKVRKDGKPDGRSTRLKAIHAEARALRDEANAQQPVRAKIGRPTKYNPAMCERVLELGTLGKTREQIAVDLDIGWKTLHRWEGLHPAFRHALKEARMRSLAYWQGIVQEAIRGERKVNGLALIFGTKNMFPDYFKDQNQTQLNVKHSGSDAFEALLARIAEDKRAERAKLIDEQAVEGRNTRKK